MQERTLNGPAVKAVREALGIKASEFAIKCGMTPGQLSSIENCRKPASAGATRRIVEALTKATPPPPHPKATRVDMWLALTYPTQEAVA